MIGEGGSIGARHKDHLALYLQVWRKRGMQSLDKKEIIGSRALLESLERSDPKKKKGEEKKGDQVQYFKKGGYPEGKLKTSPGAVREKKCRSKGKER